MDLHNNSLTDIKNTLGHTLKRLKTVLLQENKLYSVGFESFNALVSLQKLDLSSNKISNIEAGAFKGMHSLKTLHLQKNNLFTVAPGTLFGLASLKTLDLHKNNITTLEMRAFEGLSLWGSLTLLLHNNSLVKLGLEPFEHLARPLSLTLGPSSTPFECSGLCWLWREQKAGTITLNDPETGVNHEPTCSKGETWQLPECSNRELKRTLCFAHAPLNSSNCFLLLSF